MYKEGKWNDIDCNQNDLILGMCEVIFTCPPIPILTTGTGTTSTTTDGKKTISITKQTF